MLLCWTLLCGRQRRSHQRRRCSLRCMGHCWHFPAHYAWSCPTTSLLPPFLSSRIYAFVFFLHRPHHSSYLLLSPLSCLTTSLQLLYRSPRVSTTILIHHPYHLACLILLSSPWRSHLLLTPPSRIYASTILIVLHICHGSDIVVSVIPRVYHCRAPFLRPRSIPLSRSYWAMQVRILGATLWSVGCLHSNKGATVVITVGWKSAIISGPWCSGFGRPGHPQQCVFQFWAAKFSLGEHHICSESDAFPSICSLAAAVAPGRQPWPDQLGPSTFFWMSLLTVV